MRERDRTNMYRKKKNKKTPTTKKGEKVPSLNKKIIQIK